jgi:enoyl-CoA hydratase/carnithine racemase
MSAQPDQTNAPESAAVGERRGPVAIIRLNRPAALNSVNQ